MIYLLVEPIYQKDLQFDRFTIGCGGTGVIGYEGFIVNEGHRGIGTVISQMVFDVLNVFPRLSFIFGNGGCQRVSIPLVRVIEISIMIPDEGADHPWWESALATVEIAGAGNPVDSGGAQLSPASLEWTCKLFLGCSS